MVDTRWQLSRLPPLPLHLRTGGEGEEALLESVCCRKGVLS